MAGTCRLSRGLCQAIGAALADQHPGFHQGPDALLQEKGVALGALDQEPLERHEAGIVPQEGLQQFLGARGGQGVEPELRVVGLVPPAVLVLGAVVDEQEQAGGGQALDQAVEDRLGLGVDPVQVLEDQQQRLHLALAQQQALDGLEGALAALRGIEVLPVPVLDRHVQEREEGRQGRPEGRIQGEELAGELLADLAPVVAVVDLEVGLEEVAHGEVGSGLAVGDRAAFEQEPAVGVMGADELVDQAGLAHPGLPDHRHDLAVAGAGMLQGLAQGLDLRLPPDETGEPTGGKRLQARPGGCGTDELEHLHRVRQPLDRDGAQRFDLDKPFGQPQGLPRGEHRARRRHLLHPRGQVGRLAHRRVVHVQAAVNRPHHHLPQN